MDAGAEERVIPNDRLNFYQRRAEELYGPCVCRAAFTKDSKRWRVCDTCMIRGAFKAGYEHAANDSRVSMSDMKAQLADMKARLVRAENWARRCKGEHDALISATARIVYLESVGNQARAAGFKWPETELVTEVMKERLRATLRAAAAEALAQLEQREGP